MSRFNAMSRFNVSVDRFEGEVAVLVFGPDVRVDFPRAVLPFGCREGDVIDFTAEVNRPATDAARDETRRVRDELSKADPGGDITL